MRDRKVMDPISLGKSIGPHGFAAVVEATSSLRYGEFLSGRYRRKVYQTKKAEEQVVEAIAKFNEAFPQKRIEGFRTARGLAIHTNDTPQYFPRGIAFSIIINDLERYRFETSYLRTAREAYDSRDEDANILWKKLVKLEDRLDLMKLIKNDLQEKRNASDLVGIGAEAFGELMSVFRGRLIEHYFQLFFDDYFKSIPSIIIPNSVYIYEKRDREKRLTERKAADIDFIISCEEEKFYDTLRVMGGTHNVTVAIDNVKVEKNINCLGKQDC